MSLPSNDPAAVSPFNPAQAAYFDRINQVFNLTDAELDLLKRNGFLVTDRLTFEEFKRAYAYIYWKDLPVLVTTDSILHAIHQTHEKVLIKVERNILTEKFITLLSGTRTHLRQAAQTNSNPRLKTCYSDLDLYLTIPLAFLHKDEVVTDDLAQKIIQLIQNSGDKVAHNEKINLFGLSRSIDLSIFTPRGHYEYLKKYFWAVTWLGVIDFRFVTFDPLGKPELHLEQLVAAHLLRNAIEEAGQGQTWNEIESLLTAFISWSDNITINGLDAFIADTGIHNPADYFTADSESLLKQLLEKDYGQSKIGSYMSKVHPKLDTPLPNNISYALFGQRYTIESYLMNQVIYDRLIVNGNKIKRPYPSPLDVLYTLGNNRAADHLTGEFEKYGYREHLDTLRQQVESTSHEYWESSFYNLWLNAIRALNQPITPEQLPPALRSPAWSDKILHTQLASWGQLRHDHILYAKPVDSFMALCDYPSGYVEPYPDFYRAVGDYARFGQSIFRGVKVEQMEWKPYPPPVDSLFGSPTAPEIHQTIVQYFVRLEEVAWQLEVLARKELSNETFTEAEIAFLRSVMVHKYLGGLHEICGNTHIETEWDGWYNDLLPFDDDSSVLVADIAANMDARLGPVGVLHIGTGAPVIEIVIINDCAYAGPAFTYYEHLAESDPLFRMTDENWALLLKRSDQLRSWNKALLNADETTRRMLQQRAGHTLRSRNYMFESAGQAPPYYIASDKPVVPPDWVSSFRLLEADQHVLKLKIPGAYEFLGISEEAQRAIEKSEKLNRRGKLVQLSEILRVNPDALLDEYFTPEIVKEVTQKLREHGYLQ